jgi:hypothetical protein
MRLFDRVRVSLEALTQTERGLKYARCSHLIRSPQTSLCVAVLANLVLSLPSFAAQKSDYTEHAEIDAQGNIYVSSDRGKLIKMADAGHCMEGNVARDTQTFGCAVTVPLRRPAESWQPLQLEIYLRGGLKRTIEPGAPIREWHFWKDGQFVAVYFGPLSGPGTYELFDIPNARVVERVAEPADKIVLPQWAKGLAQLQDEAVPMSAGLAQERTAWIAKILRQIGEIKPGMQRKDLSKVFTTEGGRSNRFERTYVSTECPYIKVDVQFKPVKPESDATTEDPEDVIESISRPYLQWSVMD